MRTIAEDALVERIARSLVPKRSAPPIRGLRIGLGDDAAVFRPTPGYETVLTCDWFLEGTHFLREKHPADAVGWKCLARAVSDLAAMGGTPRCFLLSLALPEALTGPWLDGLLGGLRRAARKLDCALTGGDTTRKDKVLISVTVIGEAKAGRFITRSGAKAGDVIFVSGELGAAEAGLHRLKQLKGTAKPTYPALHKHLYPEPRLELGRWLAEQRIASAMMDLSDGLSSDLPRLCKASGVGAAIDGGRLPVIRGNVWGAKNDAERLRLALHGGDDYELLFTVPRKNLSKVPRRFGGVALTAIGSITRKTKMILLDSRGRESLLSAGGWDPFRKK